MQRRGVATLAAVLLASACGNHVEGTPLAGSPAEPWDPCSIPAQAIEATGLDPISKKEGWTEGIAVDEWALCTWQGNTPNSSYFFRVLFSNQRDLEDIRFNPLYTDISTIAVGQHNWLQYRSKAIPADSRCDVAFQTIEGVAAVAVEVLGGLPPLGTPCDIVYRHAYTLIEEFPPQA
ncbi:DUF3558 domain-containing protein [Rhodococcoides yunnanense]|uniref:DUF3558 domain-containing protein n=1 Tax=Rhodococcoides yunnanense TaxID=278209 RepID=UPI00093404A5